MGRRSSDGHQLVMISSPKVAACVVRLFRSRFVVATERVFRSPKRRRFSGESLTVRIHLPASRSRRLRSCTISSWFQPPPTPNRNRPRLTWSIEATSLAVWIGSRCAIRQMPVPSSSVLVTAAAAPSRP